MNHSFFRSGRRRAPLLLLLWGAVACSEAPAASEPGPDAFPGSAGSLDALGATALNALIAADTARLETLRLSESEHNDVVFPELPAGRPEVGYPVDLAWENIELRNARDVARQIRWFRDRVVTPGRTVCSGQTQTFETFVVHTDCVVRFQDSEEGALEVVLFEDVLERDGGFKIFRFYDHAPRRVPSS